MKVVFHYEAGPRLARELERLRGRGLEVAACAEADDGRFAALIRDAQVLWHVLKPVTAAVVAAAPRLRLIQKIGTGINTIDLDAAAARAIAVCNMPGTNSRAVAEMTLALMLAALRRLPMLDALTRAGRGWALAADFPDSVGELGGRSVGLVGYGAVPRILAPVLVALGARLLYTASAPKADAQGEWRSLEGLLAEADVVSLHLPLTPATERLLDARAFARMKPGAVLVNTARGGLVDEAALLDALERGHLAAAGLDVFAREPVVPDDPLLLSPRVVVAPHVAWLTPETLERSLAVAADNCERLRAGRELRHRVA